MALLGDTARGDLTLGDFVGPSLSIEDALTKLAEEPWRLRSWWIRAKPRDSASTGPTITTVDVDKSTDGHRTFPTDAEETQFDERVLAPYSLTYGLKQDLWGLVRSAAGQVVLSNASGDLTELAEHDWFGRELKVFLGPHGGTFVQFAQIADLLSLSLGRTEETITIEVDDHARLFDNELQLNTYAGTGGLEGGDELKGKVKDLALGFVQQIQPKLVDGTNRIYQVSDGSFKSIGSTQDEGVDLVFDIDVPDIEAASAPAAGEWISSVDTGYIRLGSDPEGTITCRDIEGHNSSALGYVETVAGLIKLLATHFSTLDVNSELEGVGFADLATRTAVMGRYFTRKGTTIADAIETFSQSALSWAWMTPNKLLKVGRIVDPDTASVDFTLASLNDELRISPWRDDSYETPLHQVRVGYARYHRTLSESEIDTSVITDLATRLDLDQEYRFVETSDVDSQEILDQTPQAVSVTVLTDLANEADAQALADEHLALRRVPRRKAVFAPRVGLIVREIGQVFTLIDDRLPDSPKNFVITGVANKAAGVGTSDKIEFECYG